MSGRKKAPRPKAKRRASKHAPAASRRPVRQALPPLKKPRKMTASDGSTWVVKRVGDQEMIVLKTREATRKPRLKRADFVWNPFYRSFKKNKKPSN